MNPRICWSAFTSSALERWIVSWTKEWMKGEARNKKGRVDFFSSRISELFNSSMTAQPSIALCTRLLWTRKQDCFPGFEDNLLRPERNFIASKFSNYEKNRRSSVFVNWIDNFRSDVKRFLNWGWTEDIRQAGCITRSSEYNAQWIRAGRIDHLPRQRSPGWYQEKWLCRCELWTGLSRKGPHPWNLRDSGVPPSDWRHWE